MVQQNLLFAISLGQLALMASAASISGMSSTMHGKSSSSASRSGPVVDLGYAKYTGYYNETSCIDSYFGIYYAANPTGEQRWRPAQPIESHNNYSTMEPIDATKIGPSCPLSQIQPPPDYGYVEQPYQSEDCLLLNVLVPHNPTSDRLPVLVEIHGGGYDAGNAEVAPGDALVYKSNGSMIYVAIQYRLGLLGFLAGSEVKENGILNAGLLDQRMALEWVQRHISAFGGDPDKVTIAGESAGGGSVSYQLMAYGGSGVAPFRAAIPELPWWQPLKNDTLSEEEYQRVLRNTSCMDIECLRMIPEQSMITITQNSVGNSFPNAEGSFGQYATGDFVFGPVVDGDFIRGLPTAEFKAGRYYRVPIMTNHESAEGNIFTDLNETASELPGDLHRIFNQPSQYFLDTLMALYPRGDYESVGLQRAALFGNLYVDCGTLAIATSASQWGNNQSAIFKFNSSAYGGLHGTIGDFVYQPYINSESYLNPSNIYLNGTLASILQSYYVSFTKYMDPNPGRDAFAPFFPSYQPSQQILQVSDSDIVVGMDADNGIKCYFYEANPQTTRN